MFAWLIALFELKLAQLDVGMAHAWFPWAPANAFLGKCSHDTQYFLKQPELRCFRNNCRYTGEDCSQCAAGYLKSGKICVIDVVAQQLVKTSPKASPFPPIQQPPAPDTPDIGVTDSQSSTDNSSSNNEGIFDKAL